MKQPYIYSYLYPCELGHTQVATITGVDDDIIDGSQTSTITVSIDDANSDDDFDAVADQTVSVSTTDDDVAGSRFLKLKDPQGLMNLEPLTSLLLFLMLNQHQML